MALSFIQKRFVSTAVSKTCRNWSGFYKMGLFVDDCIGEDDPDVVEALRRLPQDIMDLRNYRILRAVQLNLAHSILPKEQWVKFENDERYLKPYLDEVIAERLEREEWDKTH